MTTATSTFTWANTTTADVKIWMDGVESLLLAAGLVKTTDTGQITVSSYASTPTASTQIGYHVFKFPDALQATTPIVLAIYYSTDSANRPAIRLSVGSATDGAGAVATPSFVAPLANAVNVLQANLTSYACYVDGTFTMVLGNLAVASVPTNNALSSLVIDRARNATGVALGDGFLVEGMAGGFQASGSRSLYGGASPATSSSFIPALVPNNTAIGTAEGANVNVFRHYMMVPGVRPSLGSLTYFNAEFGALSTLTATVLGSSHTYLPMGAAMTPWSVNQTTGHCGAIRWE